MAAATIPHLHTTRQVSGFTHSYYRYPATTSPELVRDVVLAYSRVDDIVLDPFMGGGTSVVEAIAHGRRAIGVDLNPLAVMIARAKTTPLGLGDWAELSEWASGHIFSNRAGTARDERTRNLPQTLHRPLASALGRIASLRKPEQRLAARCALLSVGRWALETNDTIPRPRSLQRKLEERLSAMQRGMDQLIATAKCYGVARASIRSRRLLTLSAAEDVTERLENMGERHKADLVVTSPPYPGVHVLYHRWQVDGRRETPAAYWLAGARDGAGPSFYTMGGRSGSGQLAYFDRLETIYAQVRKLLRPNAVVAQLVAFHDAQDQLPRFLKAMRRAGYEPLGRTGSGDLSRLVPNRRWYARGRAFDASREFLLLHRPRS